MESGESVKRRDGLKEEGNEVRGLWRRIWIAANKAVAFLIAVVIHWLLAKSIKLVLPGHSEGWEKVEKLLEAAVAVPFVVIYVHMAWDLVTAFVGKDESKVVQRENEEQNSRDTDPQGS